MAETRKTVTVVFTDVVGSTSLGERLDPEAFRHVMSRLFAELRPVLERQGGSVAKFIGDASLAVFGVPAVHEDDPLRAVRASAEMRDALGRLDAMSTRARTPRSAMADPDAQRPADTARVLAIALQFAQTAERNARGGDRVTVGYVTRPAGRLPRRWRARAKPRARRLMGRGWLVRSARQPDLPRTNQSSITITRSGRVLLDAEWQPNMRERSLSDPQTVLVDRHEDVDQLERDIADYLAQRLAKRRGEIRFQADSETPSGEPAGTPSS